jgi:hypothetical protein
MRANGVGGIVSVEIEDPREVRNSDGRDLFLRWDGLGNGLRGLKIRGCANFDVGKWYPETIVEAKARSPRRAFVKRPTITSNVDSKHQQGAINILFWRVTRKEADGS